jgi:3-oxoacyl-[acyl-carrier-protein] synthase-1
VAAVGALCVTGVGAITAVGMSAVQTAASVRARISRLRAHPHHHSMIDPPYRDEPEPLTCGPVALLDPLDRAPDRLLNLALAPLQDVITDAGLDRTHMSAVGLFMAAAPVVEGVPEWGLEQHFLPEFFRRAALKPFSVARIVRQGPTGVFRLLQDATGAIGRGECRFALVGGVDSYLDEETIARFDATYRLKSARNRDGFIPGEAAAWLLLETPDSARQRGKEILAIVGAASLAREEQPFVGDSQSTGRGLTEALRLALAGNAAGPDWVVCDLNGESYRAYEWGLAISRLGPALGGLKAVWHPADSFGDVRSAGPAVHAVLACQAFRRAYAPGSRCLIFAGEDGGERGACLISRVNATAEERE